MANYPDKEDTKSVIGWGFWALGIVLVFAIGIFLVRWALVPTEVYSPENVSKQWAFAYEYSEKLKMGAVQVCIAEKAVAAATTDNEAAQRRSQLMAYEQNYARMWADYNARLKNNFEAGLVAPSDVPDKAPTLEESKKAYCPRPA